MSRKLKARQRGPWCQYCEPKTTRAVYRDYGFHNFACEEHKGQLPKDPDDYMTEGEWQAFGRFGY